MSFAIRSTIIRHEIHVSQHQWFALSHIEASSRRHELLQSVCRNISACSCTWRHGSRPPFMYTCTLSSSIMPQSKLCQRCRGHRTRFRRQCYVCHRWVGPGCVPPCLWQDGLRRPLYRSLCRDCVPLHIYGKVRTTAKTLPEALQFIVNLRCW